MLAGWELALGLAAMFFGAIVLGTFSFGLGTVAMPFILLILPPQDAVVIVNAVVVLTTGLTVVQTWRHLNLKESWPFVVAGLPPVPIGVLLLHGAAPVALRLTIVVIILSLGVMRPVPDTFGRRSKSLGGANLRIHRHAPGHDAGSRRAVGRALLH